MKNQIIALEEKNRKIFGFTDEQIIVSSKGHNTMEALVAATEKSGILETVKVITIASVKELSYNEKDINFKIRYDKKGKIKKETVVFSEREWREPIAAEIAELIALKKTTTTESKIKPLLLNLAGAIAVGVITWGGRSMAIDLQNGEEYVATGRRSGLKQLMATAIEALGPNGVLIVGSVLVLLMFFKGFKRFTNPAMEVTYS